MFKKQIACTLLAAAALSAGASSMQAAVIYWDGGNGSWGTVSSWSTDSANDTPNPGAVPGSGDSAVFNRSGNNAVNEAVTLDAARVVQGITIGNSGTTTLNQGVGGAASTLTVNNAGASSIAVTGGGAATINTDVIVGTGGSGGVYTFDAGSGSLVISGQVSSPRTGSRTWTFNSSGSGYVELSGGIRLNSAASNVNNRINEIAGNGLVVISGAISRGGASASTLETASTFAGTLRLSAPSNDSTAVFKHKGGTIEFANNTSLPALGMEWSAGKIAAYGASQTVTSIISGIGSNTTLEITGSEDLTLTDFRLSATSGGSPTANRRLNVTNTGVTTLGGSFVNFNANGTTANTVILDTAVNSRLVISGVIRNSASSTTATSTVNKEGLGILELTNANTFISALNVNAGTVLANNSSGSAAAAGTVAVAANARLGGDGIITGATSLVSDAILAPGSQLTGTQVQRIGSLATGATTLADGFTYEWDLGTPGNDVLNVTGNLVGGAITAATNATTLAVNVLDPTIDPTGVTYILATYSGADQFGINTLLNWTIDSTGAPGSWDFAGATVTYRPGTNDIVLSGITFSEIPEPGTLSVLALGTAALLTRRRRTA